MLSGAEWGWVRAVGHYHVPLPHATAGLLVSGEVPVRLLQHGSSSLLVASGFVAATIDTCICVAVAVCVWLCV